MHKANSIPLYTIVLQECRKLISPFYIVRMGFDVVRSKELMLLKMFLLEELIDSIDISPVVSNFSDHLTFLKYELMLKNEDLLSSSAEEPTFVIDTVPSRMNTVRKDLDWALSTVYKNKKNKE